MLSASIPSWLQNHTSNMLIKAADQISRNVGLRVTLTKNSLDGKRAELLQKLGVTVVFDVGANSGQYTQLIRDFGYKQQIISFDPVPDAYQLLNSNSAGLSPHIACQLTLDATDP